MTDPELGVRYERPADNASTWAYDELRSLTEHRLARALRVELELAEGARVTGALEGADPPTASYPHGVIELDGPRDVASEQVIAFTLYEQPLGDRSDEVRGR